MTGAHTARRLTPLARRLDQAYQTPSGLRSHLTLSLPMRPLRVLFSTVSVDNVGGILIDGGRVVCNPSKSSLPEQYSSRPPMPNPRECPLMGRMGMQLW